MSLETLTGVCRVLSASSYSQKKEATSITSEKSKTNIEVDHEFENLARPRPKRL